MSNHLQFILNELEQIFVDAFELVKININRNYQKDEHPESITPNERAILIGASKLPCKVEIVDVDCSKFNLAEIDSVCHIIKYDLTKLGKLDVTYYGTVLFDKNQIYQILVDKFKEDVDHARFVSELLIKHPGKSGFPNNDDETHIEFTNYDIRKNSKKFIEDLPFTFYSSFNDYFVKQFKTEKERNFNSEYNLQNDPILSPLDLLKPDPRINISLEKLQLAISNIQLIPEVPESVRIEFQRAKDLFVFSYFKYEFSTLSERSALFAHETAMKQRYIQSLNGKASISYKSKIVHEITSPTYSQISDFLHHMRKTKGWQLRDVQVNDEKFPFNMPEVINWLVRNVSPKWKLDLYDAGRELRNSHAHSENVIIHPPSATILQNIAQDINEMFASR